VRFKGKVVHNLVRALIDQAVGTGRYISRAL
jgi:hypothetical protein